MHDARERLPLAPDLIVRQHLIIASCSWQVQVAWINPEYFEFSKNVASLAIPPPMDATNTRRVFKVSRELDPLVRS